MADHGGFSIKECGLVISPKVTFLAASPDGLVSCECCGAGVLEVKCPFKCRTLTVPEYLACRDSCFCINETGDIDVKHSHQYYYQMQAQMFVCDVQYCDFVVCTFPAEQAEIFVKRVYRDTEFLEKCLKSANHFFRSCVLPELMGRAYSRPLTV